MADHSVSVKMSDNYSLLVGSATYPTRATLEAGRGAMLMRGVMEPGRYDGAAIGVSNEEATIPAGTRLLMYHGLHGVVNVYLDVAIVESTNEAGGQTVLVARITQDAQNSNLQFNVLAVAPGDVDGNDITLGTTAAGTFVPNGSLDASGRFL